MRADLQAPLSAGEALVLADLDRLSDTELASMVDLVNRDTHTVIAASRPGYQRLSLTSATSALAREHPPAWMYPLTFTDVAVELETVLGVTDAGSPRPVMLLTAAFRGSWGQRSRRWPTTPTPPRS